MEYQNITADQLRAYMVGQHESGYVLIDVRQPDEYAEGLIPGAVLAPLAQLPVLLQELPLDRDLILYCRSGTRSRVAAVFAGSQPCRTGTVFNLLGGVLAWEGRLLSRPQELAIPDQQDDRQGILLRALHLERGLEHFYLTLHQRYSAVDWMAPLAGLITSEKAHAHTVYSLWAEGQGAPASFETVYGGLHEEAVAGGYSHAELLILLDRHPLEPSRAALEVGLNLEYTTYDLYCNLAHLYTGHATQKLIEIIAEDEKDHMRIVAGAIGECSQ